MYYAPVSDFHVTIYEHLNFSRAFVVQFQRSRYIMRLNRTSVRKVTTIWISRELPIFNCERLNLLSAWIDFCVTSYDHMNFSRAFVVQCRASRYSMRLNRTSVWKVTTIWISQELPIFNLERLESNFRVKSYDPWNFSRGSAVQFRGSGYIMRLDRTSVWQVMTIWISRELPL